MHASFLNFTTYSNSTRSNIIDSQDPRYVLTNTTLQFTSYAVNDLLTTLSNIIDDPSLTPLRPVEPSWILNDESLTFTCGVCSDNCTCEQLEDLLNSRSFNIVTLDRKYQYMLSMRYVLFVIDPVSFLSSGNRIYNNSIINDFDDDVPITCKSIYGSSRLKFHSDNEILNTFFDEENYNSPTLIGGTTVTLRNISDYEIELTIAGTLIDANITCFSEDSGKFSTILTTNGMIAVVYTMINIMCIICTCVYAKNL